MDEREQQRKIRHRLGALRHAQEVTGDVSATCRYYGISRPTFYKWLHRFEELGEEGLRDRSSAPLRCPNETPADIVGKIIYLRQSYHFGPRKISMYLRGQHQRPVVQAQWVLGAGLLRRQLELRPHPPVERRHRLAPGDGLEEHLHP